jgi:hypothetical protein
MHEEMSAQYREGKKKAADEYAYRLTQHARMLQRE